MKIFYRSILIVFISLLFCTTPVYAIDGDIFLSTTEQAKEGDIETEEIIPMPRYNQYDYPDVPYCGKTLADRGCGITCASMIATYLLQDETLTPEYLASIYGDYDNKVESIDYNSLMDVATSVLEELGIKLTLTYNFDDVWLAACQGKPVLSLQNEGLFTDKPNGHFIVFNGMTEDYRMIIHDPNGFNWSKYKDYFENGFWWPDLYDTASGYWICEIETDDK